MLPMVPGACTAGGAPLPRRRRCLANSAPVGVAALLCALLASAGPSGAAASSSPSATGTRGGDYGGVVINEIMYNERSGNKKQQKDLLANEAGVTSTETRNPQKPKLLPLHRLQWSSFYSTLKHNCLTVVKLKLGYGNKLVPPQPATPNPQAATLNPKP